jgi:hypothetical protein
MRPLRLLLSLSTSLVLVILLLYATLVTQQDEQLEQNSTSGKQGGFKALFSFTSPGSLFPPSAIISLTDDNSTFFLARPAAFGPALPKDGLSSALWIGSGFGDDALGKGELGCGDSPDWDNRNDGLKLGTGPLPISRPKDSKDTPITPSAGETLGSPAFDDGTDDHLRMPATGYSAAIMSKTHMKQHFDIQSLQESAEIDGKVVLLKRGGCGFLAKVMWAQKRGAVAVIVGDNVRGGGLIRMYAQGDTSNVTIASLFTSHTTAHLLSSLLPGSTINGLSSGDITNTNLNKGGAHGNGKSEESKLPTSKTPFISSYIPPISAPTSTPGKQGYPSSTDGTVKPGHQEHGWSDAILSALNLDHEGADSLKADFRRPPSSGDVDLLSVTTSTSRGQAEPSPTPARSQEPGANVLPGSGEYPHPTMTDRKRKAWWNKSFDSRKDTSTPQAKHANGRSITSITDVNLDKVEALSDDSAPHEGLWVTLTPTNVSSSPFFDTLLVLVVSPLVTLTVVYALLLLRSRIRRRRWRAPKSLVERLPVRTYQTMSDSTSSATPAAASPTTPLLQHSPTQPTSSVYPSYSQGEDEIAATSSAVQTGGRTREEEKRETGLAEWRRRYGGRQKECVVCLEEYVDGISQVMSLPCGHEFHADCM